MKRTSVRMVIMLLLVGGVAAGLNWFVNFRAGIITQVLAGLRDPAQTVSTTTAKTDSWQSSLSAIGTFRAVNGADLSLEVSGIIDQIYFTSGDDVKEGQVLLDLRKADDVAKLNSLTATADGTSVTLQRDLGQLKINAVSQATVDTDIFNQKAALANVVQQKALVEQKTLKAPFAGRLGIRSVDLGQFISAGTTIVTLQALEKLYLDFSLPQQAVAEVKPGQAVDATIDAFPNTVFVGQITALNSKVDQNSRNVQVRASFDNSDHRLLPGMYASVSVRVGAPRTYITLPQTAVVFNSYGNSVYLAVKPEGGEGLVAKQAFVRTGETRGDQVAILSGIKEGATVVTAGQIKLRNGTKLIVDDSVAIPDSANPKPADQ